METRQRLVIGFLAGLSCLVVSGCSRRAFRARADQDATNAIHEKGGYLEGGSIYAQPDSRMFDPYSADCPPMPPDDPLSHQLMHYVDGKRGYKHWDKFARISSVEPAFSVEPDSDIQSALWLAALPRDEQGTIGLDLRDSVRVRNQEMNIAALRDSLGQLEAAFDANRISSRLQVDQARQALLNAQGTLLSSRAAYQSRVDSFKIELGLPPELPVEISDALLDRFILIDPKLTQLQNELAEILLEIRLGRQQPTLELINSALERLAGLDESIDRQLESALADLAGLDEQLPARKQQLKTVARQIRELKADVDPRVYDEQTLLQRIDFLKRRMPLIVNEFGEIKNSLAAVAATEDEVDDHQVWKQVNAHAARLSDLLLELSLVHAEIRLQAIGLLPIEIQPEDALALARLNTSSPVKKC